MRFPILLVTRWTWTAVLPPIPFAPGNLVSRDRFGCPVLFFCQPAHFFTKSDLIWCVLAGFRPLPATACINFTVNRNRISPEFIKSCISLRTDGVHLFSSAVRALFYLFFSFPRYQQPGAKHSHFVLFPLFADHKQVRLTAM